MTHRHAEALSLGVPLISQDLSGIETGFPFRDGKNVMYCQADLADLVTTVRDAQTANGVAIGARGLADWRNWARDPDGATRREHLRSHPRCDVTRAPVQRTWVSSHIRQQRPHRMPVIASTRKRPEQAACATAEEPLSDAEHCSDRYEARGAGSAWRPGSVVGAGTNLKRSASDYCRCAALWLDIWLVGPPQRMHRGRRTCRAPATRHRCSSFPAWL